MKIRDSGNRFLEIERRFVVYHFSNGYVGRTFFEENELVLILLALIDSEVGVFHTARGDFDDAIGFSSHRSQGGNRITIPFPHGETSSARAGTIRKRMASDSHTRLPLFLPPRG